ncbi:MAG: rod shape-determining protein RodA, partial [Anaerolineae bacterium]|nr:rod shape-determining protein RodA [Anaerolineae bacterium]
MSAISQQPQTLSTRAQGLNWRHFDWILFFTIAALIVFGLLMINSATFGAVDPELQTRVSDQVTYAIIGVMVMFGLAIFDYKLLGGMHVWLYLLMVFLLLLVNFLGVEGDAGAQRWINLGIRIQPSEIGKILIIITLGHYLASRYQRIGELRVIGGSLLHLAVPAGLVFIQPNLGTTIVFGVIWFALVWAAGLKIKHIITFIVILAIGAPILYSQMLPYQRSRIDTFLNPEGDPQAYFNIRQALISIGSGGVLGKGYAAPSGQNRLRFLRVRHTDFIFSVISEEFGMVGGLTVMGLIGLVVSRILRGARLAADPLGMFICYGVAAIIFFQTFVSLGMNLGLLPVTGLTLP